jgi:predicted adenylyl cyclase CyaB
MAANVEIKARARDPAELYRRAADLSGGPAEQIAQEDVVFPVPQGRLKLRVFSPERGELIAYRRDDRPAAKTSEYAITPTQDPASLRATLAAALGVQIVVRKQRRLFRVGQTRVHLDEVEGLGAFVELEYVLRPGEDRGRGAAEIARLMRRLDIRDEDLVATAYADLLAGS